MGENMTTTCEGCEENLKMDVFEFELFFNGYVIPLHTLGCLYTYILRTKEAIEIDEESRLNLLLKPGSHIFDRKSNIVIPFNTWEVALAKVKNLKNK